MNLNFFNLDSKIKTKVIPLEELIYKYEEAFRIGDIVTTSRGFNFEFLGNNIWKDLTSGITWYDIENRKHKHDEAIDQFKNRLPSKEDFKLAELHGFREILPSMKNNRFWSSSVRPNDSGFAYFFGGNDGDVYYGYRSFSGSVRCVGR